MYENGFDTLIDQQVSRDFQHLWYKSRVVQVILTFGGPYENFTNLNDRRDEQASVFDKWAEVHLTPLLASATAGESGGVALAFVGDGGASVLSVVQQDAMFALGASKLFWVFS